MFKELVKNPVVVGLISGVMIAFLYYRYLQALSLKCVSAKVYHHTPKMVLRSAIFSTPSSGKITHKHNCSGIFLFLSVLAYWSGYSLIWRGCVQIVNKRKVLTCHHAKLHLQ